MSAIINKKDEYWQFLNKCKGDIDNVVKSLCSRGIIFDIIRRHNNL